MQERGMIDYIELPARDIEASKRFFTSLFGWTFSDFGNDYSAFYSSGLNGGFYRADLSSRSFAGGALVVLYSDQLEETKEQIEAAGGVVIKEIFSFPGGHRFHFTEPSGNELAVWSDKGLNK